MSRPVSRKSSAKSKTKVKKKTPKQQIAELTEENTALTTELETLKLEAALTRDKIDIVTHKLIGNIRKKDFGLSDETEAPSVPTDTLVDIIDKLVVKKQIHEVSVEERVEMLEARVTDMTMSLAKMTTKTTAYETGLEEVAMCHDLDTIKDKVYRLQLIAGQEYHTFASNDPNVSDKDRLNGYHDDHPPNGVRRSLNNAHLLNLKKPSRKSAGETLIRNMHKDLKMFIIQELSQEKPSGGDWRRLAERIGLPDDTIREWMEQKLKYPMGRVLDHWSTSPGASVRMLHRHLVSPQMRCTLVAKRLSDFYEID